MAGPAPSPSTGSTTVVPAPGSANSPANSPAFLNAANTVYGDLNSGNYTGAWNTALGTSSMFGTNQSAQTTDPLLQALETSQGLKSFDPTKQWSSSSLDAYYAAFNGTNAYHGINTGTNGNLGQNPYGVWGGAGAITSGSDQAANIAQEGTTPDVARFAGARPAPTFMQKWGKPALEIAGTVAAGLLAPEAIGAISGGLDAGLTSSAGAALGGGSFLGSAAGGVAEGAVAGGLYGAGTGAALGALGGNAGKGAELGALGGGVVGGIGAAGNYLGAPTGATNAVGSLGSNLAKNAVSGNGSTNGTNYLGAGAGVQGNSTGMATSTDTGLASTITGALPGVLQAGAGAGSSLAGANAQVGALNNSITTQQNNLGNIQGVWGTQQGLGQGADTALGSALGTNGQPANYSGFENMPGYAFAQQQGTQAIQRQAAAMGNAYTPNTAAAVGQYVTGTAMQDYNTYISQLMGAAGLGTTANQGLQTANQATANNISTAQQNIGQAQAGGISGVGSATAGLFSPTGAGSSLIGAASRYLNGGSGGGGGAGSQVGGGTGGGGNYNPSLGTGNGSFGSGYDPSTGQQWTSGVGTSTPAFDTSTMNTPPGGWLDSLNSGGSTDFGGGTDFGSGDLNFLGDLGGP